MKKIIIIGGGGHAKVLIDAILNRKSTGLEIIGCIDPKLRIGSQVSCGIKVIGDDTKISLFKKKELLLVNGVGSIKSIEPRKKIYEKWSKRYTFYSVIHNTAILAKSADFAEGIQVLAGAIINPKAIVGKNSLINTGSIIEHDCHIGSHVHIAPGCVILGGVNIGDNIHIGAGTVILQGTKIGDNSIIGAGSVVVNDIPRNSLAYGSPCKVIKGTT